MTALLNDYGLLLLFLVVGLESFGVPLPGETALIAAAILAHSGHFSIIAVIAVAAAAAIVGDNAGYWAGRKGGRRLLERMPLVGHHTVRLLPPAERFFLRHGAKTVFIGRFFSILRVTAAWLAGISHMDWWRFLGWNAFGGIAWALLVGLVSYFAGHAAADAISHYGAIGGVAIVAAIVVGFVGFQFWKRRMLEA